MMQSNSNSDNYTLLINKLDEFIRKYYKNLLIRGSIYFASIFLISFLFISVIEYFGHFNSTVRTIFFYSFVFINLSVLTWYIALPLSRLLKLGNIISHKQAAAIIGKHFANVKDKLINTLELHELSNIASPTASVELIEASINQKINELKPVRFTTAINLAENKKYLKYAFIPLGITFLILLLSPAMIIDSTGRLIEHGTYFERPAPFEFELQNDTLRALRNEDFNIQLKMTGNEIPSEVYVFVENTRYRMLKNDNVNFSYKLRNLRDDMSFRFFANGFYSRTYQLKVLPKPVLKNFEITLNFPEYISKTSRSLKNVGDISIPQGTEVIWHFDTENTESLLLAFSDTAVSTGRNQKDRYSFRNTFMESDHYYVVVSNQHVQSDDSIRYHIHVIPDEFPSIQVEKETDSISLKHLYFSGEISDDYGLTRLTFNYKFIESTEPAKKKNAYTVNAIPIDRSKKIQNFYHYWNLDDINFKAGDEIEFFFEVWDNDAINGRKSSRSTRFTYKAPTLREIDEKSQIANEDIKRNLEEAIEETSELRKELEDIRREMLDKKELSWQDRQNIENHIQRQQDLKQKIEEIQKHYKQNLMEQLEYREIDKDILEKHAQLQQLFDDLLDDETKALLEELQKLLEERMTDEMREKLQDLDHSEKTAERELDRMLELFKQLELDQMLKQTQEKLEQLAQQQEELKDQTDDPLSDMDEIMEEQEDINQQFEDIMHDIEGLEKKNQELKHKRRMDDLQKDAGEIQESLEKSMEQMEQQKKQDAKDQQQKSQEKMEELAEKMKGMQMQMEMDALVLNYRALRQILENLLYFSFEQEEILNEFGQVREYNPLYVELGRKQSNLRRYARLIEDSLYSLSERVIEIRSFVTREIRDVNYYLNNAIQDISDRKIGEARRNQQSVMTSANNLAVLLSEILQQMQEQMAMQMEGDQMTGDPGEGQPSIGEMMDMQQQIQQRLKDLKEGKSGEGGEGMDEELARTAAQQEALRRMLRDLQKLMEDSREASENIQQLDELMEETEKDLLFDQITDETLKRQEEIMVRLLESEKAMRKQDMDEERQAEKAKDMFRHQPPSLEEYQQMRQREVELLQTVPPSLTNYYRLKVREYFEQIK